jgi:hypothetical protein
MTVEHFEETITALIESVNQIIVAPANTSA